MRHASLVRALGVTNWRLAGCSRVIGRLHCLHSNASPEHSPSADLFAKGRVLTLERSIGASLGRDAELWSTGAFNVSIYPDLPAVMTWPDLLRHPFRRCFIHQPSISSWKCALNHRGVIHSGQDMA
jgi:hypothetical protein